MKRKKKKEEEEKEKSNGFSPQNNGFFPFRLRTIFSIVSAKGQNLSIGIVAYVRNFLLIHLSAIFQPDPFYSKISKFFTHLHSPPTVPTTTYVTIPVFTSREEITVGQALKVEIPSRVQLGGRKGPQLVFVQK